MKRLSASSIRWATEMTLYRYKAFSEDGEYEVGTREANSEEELQLALVSTGVRPYSISPHNSQQNFFGTAVGKTPGKKLTASELSKFFSGLSVLLTSKFTLNDSLKLVQKIEPNRKLREIYRLVQEQTSSGQTFSTSIVNTLDIPAHVAAIFSSSETEGSLDGAMKRVADEFKERDKVKKELLQSLAYPVFLICLLFLVICLLSLQLVPALVPIFAGNDEKIPFLIRALDGLNDVFLRYQLPIFIGTFSLIALVIVPYSRRVILQLGARSLRRLPVVGSTMKRIVGARYLRTLGTLVESKVPITDSLELAAIGVTLSVDQNRFGQAARDVAEGTKIHAALDNANYFEDYVISMVSIGEESDNLAQMIGQSADVEAEKAQRSISSFLAVLSPTLTILIGVSVGGVVISVMTALLSLNDVVLQ